MIRIEPERWKKARKMDLNRNYRMILICLFDSVVSRTAKVKTTIHENIHWKYSWSRCTWRSSGEQKRNSYDAWTWSIELLWCLRLDMMSPEKMQKRETKLVFVWFSPDMSCNWQNETSRASHSFFIRFPSGKWFILIVEYFIDNLFKHRAPSIRRWMTIRIAFGKFQSNKYDNFVRFVS